MATSFDIDTERIHFIILGRQAVSAAYLALPRVIIISICWSVLAATVVLAAPATAVAFVVARTVLDGKTVDIRTVIWEFRHYFWRSQAVFIPFFVLIDIGWALWLQAGWLGNVIFAVILIFDILLLYSYLLLYYFPLLIERDESAVETAQVSVKLALTHARASVGLFFFSLSIAGLLSFTVVGFVLVGPGLIATIVLLATRYFSELWEVD